MTFIAGYEVNQLLAADILTISRHPLNTRRQRIAVSKKREDHEKIIAALDEAIVAMKDDGTYNTILVLYRIND